MELKTARLTILIDPAKKQAFEELCHTQDMTPSQVVRRLIRDFMDEQPAAPRRTPVRVAARPVAHKAAPKKAVKPRAKSPAKTASRARNAR